MAISTTWVNFVNGATGAAIRAALNSFNTNILADVTSNEGRIGLAEPKITLNTGDITDLDVRVTGAEADIVVLEDFVANPKESVAFVPQTVAPAHVEGTLYYDNPEGTFKAQGHTAGVDIALGHSMHVHVTNNSGAVIEKGMAVRQNGIIGGKIQVVKAIATSFVEARIFGVAQADIANGADGAITSFGEITNIDTNGYPVGVPLYLSDTVAGTWVTTPPDIITRVGGVLVADASIGRFFVSPINNQALPVVFTSLSDGTLPTTMTGGVTYDIGNFAVGDSVAMGYDQVAGTIDVSETGKYRLSLNIAMSFDNIGSSEDEVILTLRATDGSQQVDILGAIPRNSSVVSFYPSPLVSLVAGKSYQAQITPEDTLTNVVVSLAEIDLTSVHIR